MVPSDWREHHSGHLAGCWDDRAETDGPVVGDRPGLIEESEGQFGEQPGDTLCHADGTAQWDPAAPGVRLAQTRAEGQHQAQEGEALLNIKVKLEAEMASYRSLLEEGEDFNLVDALDKNPSLQIIKDHNLQDCGRQGGWCLKPMTPCVIEALKAAEVGHLGGGRRPIKSSEFIWVEHLTELNI